MVAYAANQPARAAITSVRLPKRAWLCGSRSESCPRRALKLERENFHAPCIDHDVLARGEECHNERQCSIMARWCLGSPAPSASIATISAIWIVTPQPRRLPSGSGGGNRSSNGDHTNLNA